MKTSISADYAPLLHSLTESRERLRVMNVSDEQQSIDLSKAFYRIDAAAAAIRSLLADDVSPRPTRVRVDA